ncbi:MAG: hypothetical protein K0S42_2376 [Microvirga sp.]|jgi:hypothetical protein|nr:hypothetical protein [Microvirga sp.]
MDNHSTSLAVMRKTRALSAALVLAAMTLAAHAQVGPQTGDSCSRWVICPDGNTSSGAYPNCFCGAPPEPTCESEFSCKSPGKVISGTWPNCSCSPPPSCEFNFSCNLGQLPSGTWPDCFCSTPIPPPPPKCGRCEVQIGQECIPIVCKD